ncbi:hypothetical protein VNO78_33722 [Psophocarpus tetragonolobus]|uniref:Uncharacterized protein n=1 Tax=Psophocarpus tetragonolobus TaxID=3891 RepID=A0AAN9NYP6_PSOTE
MKNDKPKSPRNNDSLSHTNQNQPVTRMITKPQVFALPLAMRTMKRSRLKIEKLVNYDHINLYNQVFPPGTTTLELTIVFLRRLLSERVGFQECRVLSSEVCLGFFKNLWKNSVLVEMGMLDLQACVGESSTCGYDKKTTPQKLAVVVGQGLINSTLDSHHCGTQVSYRVIGS